MSTTTHTPGPWKVGFSDGSGETYIVAGDEESTVVVSGVADSWGIEQGVRNPADAVLIAAAPEMLEALEQFVHLDFTKMTISDWAQAIDKGVSALKKARNNG